MGPFQSSGCRDVADRSLYTSLNAHRAARSPTGRLAAGWILWFEFVS